MKRLTLIRTVKNWLKTKIRAWLGITDPPVFMGVDLGYKDYSAIVVIKRLPGGDRAIVEIHNFPPSRHWEEIQDTVRSLAMHYGVHPKNIYEDRPMGWPPLS